MNKLLSSLDGVKRTGSNKYRAICPAHDSSKNSKTLAVQILDDGRTLCHCFAGCSALDITHAAGLSLEDLFPEDPQKNATPIWFVQKQRQEKRTKAKALHREVMILDIAKNWRLKGRKLSQKDMERERLAFERVRSAGI